MDKLTERGVQGGGSTYSPEISLSRLPQLARIERDIEKHLETTKNKGDPYANYMQYKQLQNDLNRVYNWIKTKESSHYLPLPPPAAPSSDTRPLIDFVPPPPLFKPENIMDSDIPKPKTKKRRSGIPRLIKRPGLYRSRSNLELGKRKRPPPTPPKAAPPPTPETSPKRLRSKGGPLRWASVDDARKEHPEMGRH